MGSINTWRWVQGAQVKTLEDIIAFNETNKEREMPYFGQSIFLQAQKARAADR